MESLQRRAFAPGEDRNGNTNPDNFRHWLQHPCVRVRRGSQPQRALWLVSGLGVNGVRILDLAHFW
ncbi:hypothetical protein [Lentzea kentuckyensis]|jgi:hypothetical protein|uniref:hypothetical protein n=1 Tax=Lentzea kentuckyensis TaxID=360086 RepID=UPI00117B1043|nr:hypothetical protein [Lentzea kentuckyensis]